MNYLLKSTRRFCSSTNYYNVLGVNKNCSMEEIEIAFNNLLKTHNFRFTNDKKPRELEEIFKAYGILSLEKSNLDYSTHKTKSFETNPQIKLSDVRNNLYKTEMEQKKIDLKKKYNYNEINRYNGGVPNPNTYARGKALASPGSFHSPSEEMAFEKEDEDIDFKVTPADAEEFSEWKKADKHIYNTPRSWMGVEVIKDTFAFKRYIFLFGFIGLLMLHKIHNELTRIGSVENRKSYKKLKNLELENGFLIKK